MALVGKELRTSRRKRGDRHEQFQITLESTRDPIKVAWLAGLLEGEGCFEKRKGILRIMLGSTDKDVVVKAQKIAGGAGSFYKRDAYGNRKTFYRWCIQGQAARAVMVAIRPHMGERRSARIKELLGV